MQHASAAPARDIWADTEACLRPCVCGLTAAALQAPLALLLSAIHLRASDNVCVLDVCNTLPSASLTPPPMIEHSSCPVLAGLTD